MPGYYPLRPREYIDAFRPHAVGQTAEVLARLEAVYKEFHPEYLFN